MRGVEAHDVNADVIDVTGVRIPDSVPPGTEFAVDVDLLNNGSMGFQSRFFDDVCSSRLGFIGWNLDGQAVFGPNTAFDNVCLEEQAVGSSPESTMTFALEAPNSTGTTDLTIDITGHGTGQLVDTIERTVTVSEAAPPPENPDEDAGEDNFAASIGALLVLGLAIGGLLLYLKTRE